MHRPLIAALAGALLTLGGGAAAAQKGNAGAVTGAATNNTDRVFTQLVGAGGLAEVELGKLADDRSGNDAVKQFADMMVKDHTEANSKLESAAGDARVTLPDGIDAEHKSIHGQLESLRGDAFDVAYIRGQIIDHQKTAQLLEWEIGSGQNDEMKQLAAATLPVVLAHLRRAQEINAMLTGAAVRDQPQA